MNGGSLHHFNERRKSAATGAENVSYAWKQLRLAVRALAGAEPQRKCLINAYTRLLELKPKDLPAEVRDDFTTLTRGIAPFPVKYLRQAVKAKVSLLGDAEVAAAIASILKIYDAVDRYQPAPTKAPRHPSAPYAAYPAEAREPVFHPERR